MIDPKISEYMGDYNSSTLVLPRCCDVQALCDLRMARRIADHGIQMIGCDELRL